METALQARVGRERQRYANNFRLVAGCIPYRLKLNVEKNHTGDFFNDLEVLMISTPNRHDLVFPKGGWEDDETVYQAACREALEEAGVRGTIHETELGVWEFRSKSRQNSCSQEGACRGYMFALRVTEQLEYWPEQDTHNRRWVSVIEAMQLCRYDWMRKALTAFLQRQPVMFPFTLSDILEPSSHFCYSKPPEVERVDSAINALC